MAATLDFFSLLFQTASKRNHRFGVVLTGQKEWQQSSLNALVEKVGQQGIFQLGGEPLDGVDVHVNAKQGQRLLGQECQLLICDLRSGFDANSFSAATGCVRGGGLLVVVVDINQQTDAFEQVWLQQSLSNLIVVEQGKALPTLPDTFETPNHAFEQQAKAVDMIRKVVEGHRKRPFVMTADRGRGKSSALGIAAAEIIKGRNIHILVTAPSLATVNPLFEHAAVHLKDANQEKGRLEWGGSSIQFVAPDELLRCHDTADCVLVDEASAIPIPMLQKMVERFHRLVFSTTIHGYEGCGRGFTLKFQSWLKANRPNSSFFHIEQPIRWAANDPLENWLFDSFLLNAELMDAPKNGEQRSIERLDKKRLVEQPDLLRHCFALLVNAHYQTSPNDLMLLLADPSIQLYAQFSDGVCLGCILTVEEGGLSESLLEDIELGKRRPKGHLVPVMLANQLGIRLAATDSSLRVMRIAVHPELQRKGIGQRMSRDLIEQTDFAFYSTSFGATKELHEFWRQCGFEPVKLGSQRDQSSGTHSLIMIKAQTSWAKNANLSFVRSLHYGLSNIFSDLETELVRSLLSRQDASVVEPSASNLIKNYSLGGASFDSVIPFLDDWWKQSPSLLNQASDLYIRRVVQRHSWQECVDEFGFTGRKQAEQAFREQLQLLKFTL